MDNTTLTLTPTEEDVYDLTIQLMVDEGMDILTATEHALTALPNPRPEFVLWLSGGTIARVGTENYRIADLKVE